MLFSHKQNAFFGKYLRLEHLAKKTERRVCVPICTKGDIVAVLAKVWENETHLQTVPSQKNPNNLNARYNYM